MTGRRQTEPHTCTGGDLACLPCLKASGMGRPQTAHEEYRAAVVRQYGAGRSQRVVCADGQDRHPAQRLATIPLADVAELLDDPPAALCGPHRVVTDDASMCPYSADGHHPEVGTNGCACGWTEPTDAASEATS